jgi:hypothetical protein
MKTTLKEIEKDVWQLERNNKPLICPYQTRVLVPGRMAGTIDVNQATCNSNCAMFQIKINYSDESVTVKLCNKSYDFSRTLINRFNEQKPDNERDLNAKNDPKIIIP